MKCKVCVSAHAVCVCVALRFIFWFTCANAPWCPLNMCIALLIFVVARVDINAGERSVGFGAG